MKKTWALLLILIVVGQKINAQYLEGVPLKDYEPIWFHHPWVDTLNDSNQNFSLFSEPLILDESMIAIYINDFTVPYGFLIERIDITTGDVLWRYNNFSSEKYERMEVYDVQINGDSLNVVVLEESKVLENRRYPPWFDGHVGTIVFNMNTGELISQSLTDHNDENNVVIQKEWFTRQNLIIDGNDEGYNIFNYETEIIDSLRYEKLMHLLLDRNGHLITTDTISTQFDKDTFSLSWNYKLNDTYNGHLLYNYVTGLSDNIMAQLFIYDNSFNIVDTIYLNERLRAFDWKGLQILSFDENNLLIGVSEEKIPFEDFTTRYFLFDSESQLLNEAISTYFVDRKENRRWFSHIDNDNSINGIGTTTNVDTDSLIDLYFWQSQIGNTDIDTTFKCQTSTADIEIYFEDAVYLDDGDVLLYLRYRQPSYPLQNGELLPPDWYFWIRIGKDDLVSAIEMNFDYTAGIVKCFPNPTSDLVYIESQSSKIEYLELFDSKGRLLLSKDREFSVLDLSHLVPAIYTLRLHFDDVTTCTRLAIF